MRTPSEAPWSQDHTSGAAALAKALDLWLRLTAEPDRSLREVAADLRIPASTAYRLISVFESRGLLARIGSGKYAAGGAVAQVAGLTDFNSLVAAMSRPILRKLASQLARTIHLGVLEEDMVTYLVKEGVHSELLFTREGMQLEAYCSGIGKILLADLHEQRLSQYLGSGEFVALTKHTITSPDQIREELETVRALGYAFDNAEVDEDLYCAAVPVRDGNGRVVAAISASGKNTRCDDLDLIEALKQSAGEVSARLLALGAVFSRHIDDRNGSVAAE
ncbi:IclR family transcriptional regulator [Phenylobacterium sp. VNQ135]|uniref:IclR family transcriptional regulator n=1 Tax=Phenylobacterium sp. VNQ135 TaxID=3400922 RepID=UPI003BFD1E75